jgi:hypothetical protein
VRKYGHVLKLSKGILVRAVEVDSGVVDASKDGDFPQGWRRDPVEEPFPDRKLCGMDTAAKYARLNVI